MKALTCLSMKGLSREAKIILMDSGMLWMFVESMILAIQAGSVPFKSKWQEIHNPEFGWIGRQLTMGGRQSFLWFGSRIYLLHAPLTGLSYFSSISNHRIGALVHSNTRPCGIHTLTCSHSLARAGTENLKAPQQHGCMKN